MSQIQALYQIHDLLIFSFSLAGLLILLTVFQRIGFNFEVQFIYLSFYESGFWSFRSTIILVNVCI